MSEPLPELWTHSQAQRLDLPNPGPFVRLRDGQLLSLYRGAAWTSADEGRTWSTPQPVPGLERSGAPYEGAALLRTSRGTLLLLYLDRSSLFFAWDATTREPSPFSRCNIACLRSEDDGATWAGPALAFEGYAGGLQNAVETRAGAIVIPAQDMVRHPGRNVQYTVRSLDDGHTWERSNVLDLGGHGHHDGAIEGTLIELADGRLWMLIRTNLDRFWESFSTDGGRYWRELRPSAIDASSAPGFLARLASGRLALVWNRLNLEATGTCWRRDDPQFHEALASWQRDELSLAFSADEGRTWTPPAVIARCPGISERGVFLSYPYLFEVSPGLLWITTRFNLDPPLRLAVREEDFLG